MWNQDKLTYSTISRLFSIVKWSLSVAGRFNSSSNRSWILGGASWLYGAIFHARHLAPNFVCWWKIKCNRSVLFKCQSLRFRMLYTRIRHTHIKPQPKRHNYWACRSKEIRCEHCGLYVRFLRLPTPFHTHKTDHKDFSRNRKMWIFDHFAGYPESIYVLTRYEC